MTGIIPMERIETKIYMIRNKKVMLDRDLAELYEVKTIALRQQVKRNRDHFPDDFIFQLNQAEANNLVSQNVIPRIQDLGGYLPYVFTEQGVAMLSSVLKSKRALHVNIQIMRTFAKLRELMATHRELREKIEAMEKKYDHQFAVVFDAIKKLLDPVPKPKRKIGFVLHGEEKISGK